MRRKACTGSIHKASSRYEYLYEITHREKARIHVIRLRADRTGLSYNGLKQEGDHE